MGDTEKKKQWATHPVLAKGGSSASPGAAKPRGTVVPGDVQTEGKPAPTVHLGTISYGTGNETGFVTAMYDPKGEIPSGGGTKQQNELAKMNQMAKNALISVAQILDYAKDWRKSVDAVGALDEQAFDDLKKVKAEVGAMRARRKQDPAYASDIREYMKAMKDAERVIFRIRKAEEGLQKAAALLRSDELWKDANTKLEEIKDDEAAVKAMQQKIADAKAMVGEILDVADKVIKQDWTGLASKAISFAKDAAIDALVDQIYGKDLDDLVQKLEADKERLKKLKEEALTEKVEAGRHDVQQAIIELNASRQEFLDAREDLSHSQTAAGDRLKGSDSTKVAGKMLENRAKQVHAISVANAACYRFVAIADTARNKLPQFYYQYDHVNSWLDEASRSDPAYSRGTPYGMEISRLAHENFTAFDNFYKWIRNTEEPACKEKIEYLAGPLPMTRFDEAVKTINETLNDPT